MRRLQLTAFGAPTEVLTLNEVPSPQLTSEQLLVRMEAAPLNGSGFMLTHSRVASLPKLARSTSTSVASACMGSG